MEERDTLTLTIHGLPTFNKDVDGEVFARQFFKFMQALADADRTTNGARRLKYLIEKLEKNTATAAIREQVAEGGSIPNSGIDYFQKGVEAIYHDRREARILPEEFVKHIKDIAKGAGNTFERGEIKRGANDNIILIDQNLEINAKRILDDIKRLTLGRIPLFSGTANISLDGTVKMLDARGVDEKAVVVLTAGGRQIDCLIARIPEEKLLKIWKQRCTVRGVGHYSGNSPLPDYIEAIDIEPVPSGGDWIQWRGLIDGRLPEEGDWH